MTESENITNQLTKATRWLFKIGSALITDGGAGLCRERIDLWCRDIAFAKNQGRESVIISSGAVAEGMVRLGLKRRPTALQALQATAAIGQAAVTEAYETALQKQGMHAAMVLLTKNDLLDRQSYLNARNTLQTLIDMQVIPVVNENDTVATEEIRFGDNDFLASLVANLIEADILVLLTDQQGLHEADPRTTPDAPLIKQARASDLTLDKFAGPSGALGRGGMQTKLRAARQAASSGTLTIICDGRDPNMIRTLLTGQYEGTALLPDETKLGARKRWFLGHDCQGQLMLDEGAVQMLRHKGKSLLPVGVININGDFDRGALVSCCDRHQVEFARGLVNYSAAEARLIQGCRSEELPAKLGYGGQTELVHRNNLVLM